MSTGCKLCSSKGAQSQKQKKVASRVDASNSDDEGFPFSYRRRMLNLVKICTAILKFTVDVVTLDLLSHNQERCLSFTSAYLQMMISMLKRKYCDELKFQDDQLSEVYVCLKSSFTYAGKLLNVLLSRIREGLRAPQEIYEVSNHLLDLVASVELYCGSGYAARLVTLSKQWLPDVVLGLGSRCILEQSLEENIAAHLSNDGTLRVRPWLSILANIELYEMKRSTSDDEDDNPMENEKFPAFSKLIRMMIQLLRMNHEILDAVGLVYLVSSATELHGNEFGLVLGLVHFVFKKLVTHDYTELRKLHMILGYVQKLYPQVESRVEEVENGEGLEQLLSVKGLLEPLWSFSSENGDV